MDNSASVLEAAQSLVARGAQAFWVGGDSTVSVALDSVIKLAKQSKIPIMTIIPGNPQRGTLFDFGVDFYQVGRNTGEIARKFSVARTRKAFSSRIMLPSPSW